MSDADDQHPHEHGPRPFGFALPDELVRSIVASHDRHHMREETEEAREQRFLDGLDVDGLLALRYIVGCSPENAFANSTYYIGMIETLLRVVHHVDPKTGRDPREVLDQVSPAPEPDA